LRLARDSFIANTTSTITSIYGTLRSILTQLVKMSDSGSPNMQQKPEGEQSEHLNIKVTDNNNEVFFKIKRTTQLKKLMDAFCDRQGKSPQSVRFLFEGVRVNPTDNPESLEMQDGDTLEVHQEQIGGC